MRPFLSWYTTSTQLAADLTRKNGWTSFQERGGSASESTASRSKLKRATIEPNCTEWVPFTRISYHRNCNHLHTSGHGNHWLFRIHAQLWCGSGFWWEGYRLAPEIKSNLHEAQKDSFTLHFSALSYKRVFTWVASWNLCTRRKTPSKNSLNSVSCATLSLKYFWLFGFN